MATKQQFIDELKLEFPTLRRGDDDSGYTDYTAEEYESKISEWADNRIAKEAEQLAIQEAEIQKAAILNKLGITADELRIALS